MSREVQGFVAELREAVAEGMRQCLAVAGDIQVVCLLCQASA